MKNRSPGKKTGKKVKPIKAWMPLGVGRLIVFDKGAPVGNGRMEVFRIRDHGKRYWGKDGLVRVEIRVVR